MRRTVFLCAGASFVMAFVGTVLAQTVALPAVAGAQETRIRAEHFAVVGDNGADRVALRTIPGINAAVLLLDTNGARRIRINTGRNAVGDAPDDAGLDILAPDGATQMVRLGVGHGPRGDLPLENLLRLHDWQGQARIVLRVGDDGTPSIRLFDAAGNVTWEAK